MNDADNRGRPPRRFDAFGLVARQGHLEGRVDPLDLDRLQDVLGDDGGTVPDAEIGWRIEGETDPMGRHVLHVALDGEVPLECQRCMRPFFLPVHQRSTVLLARDEKELAYLDENDEREVMLAAAPLDPLEVVEEELVLAMPYVPRCERPDCATGEEPAADAPAASPFDALARLRKDRSKGDG
ncbi:MAG: YceD family protein [Casimicrobiaceae bacterium]